MAAARGVNLRLISKVRVHFDPFQWRSASTREFLRILNTQTIRDSNPKCQINVDIGHANVDPKIEIQFADKDSLVFDSANMKVIEIFSQFNRRCQEKEKNS